MRERIRPPTYNTLKKGRTHGFGLLLDAVLMEPQKVPAIVAENPGVLYETCWVGENVLHWLAVENKHEEIRLLRSLGSPIPVHALIEAVEHGHTETVIALLELGAEVMPSEIASALNNKHFAHSKKTRSLIRRYFRQFGYEI
ncbi:ankyrin repeat domain-containing protein [Teredinibacter turnerae]|uniref:ankyrin repeat domain-containing protein n=1 Tax=Teredinibacter turnerae TaxID=2426 RepID=UPI0004768B6D|nr:ankyrin repeat domain-containing protein [Teredinibacter turnerae]